MISEKAKNIIAIVFMIALFIIASFSMYYGVYIFFPMLTHQGRFGEKAVSMLLTSAVPMITFFISYLYFHFRSDRSRWIAGCVLACIVGVFSILDLALIGSVFQSEFHGQAVTGTASLLYPLDMILVNVFYLLLVGFGVAGLVMHRDWLKAEKRKGIVRPAMSVLIGFVTVFACYWFGEFLWGATILTEGIVDKNAAFTPGFYMSFCIIPLELILYTVYAHVKKEHRRDAWIGSMASMGAWILVTYLWIEIAMKINPYVIAESLSREYEIGIAAMSTPIGLYINAVIGILLYLGSLIWLIVRLAKEKKEKAAAAAAK